MDRLLLLTVGVCGLVAPFVSVLVARLALVGRAGAAIVGLRNCFSRRYTPLRLGQSAGHLLFDFVAG